MTVVEVLSNRSYLDVLSRAEWIANFVVAIISADQVLHDATTLEHTKLTPVFERIRDSRNAAIWVDLAKPIGLLLMGAHVYFVHFVRQSQFFESDRNLDAVRSLRGVKSDSRFRHCC